MTLIYVLIINYSIFSFTNITIMNRMIHCAQNHLISSIRFTKLTDELVPFDLTGKGGRNACCDVSVCSGWRDSSTMLHSFDVQAMIGIRTPKIYLFCPEQSVYFLQY